MGSSFAHCEERIDEAVHPQAPGGCWWIASPAFAGSQ
jgi:hypothetical protein